MPTSVPTGFHEGDVTGWVDVYDTGDIDAAFGERDQRINDLEGRVNSLDNEIGGIHGAISELDSRDHNFQRDIDDIRSRLDRASSRDDVERIARDLSSLAGSIGELYARMSQMESWRAAVAPSIDTLSPQWVRDRINESLGPLQQQATALSQSLDQTRRDFQSRVDSMLAAFQQSLGNEIAAANRRIDSVVTTLSGSVSQLQSAVDATMNAAHAAAQAAEQVRQSLPSVITQYLDPAVRDLRETIQSVADRIPRLRRLKLWDYINSVGPDAATFVDFE